MIPRRPDITAQKLPIGPPPTITIPPILCGFAYSFIQSIILHYILFLILKCPLLNLLLISDKISKHQFNLYLLYFIYVTDNQWLSYYLPYLPSFLNFIHSPKLRTPKIYLSLFNLLRIFIRVRLYIFYLGYMNTSFNPSETLIYFMTSSLLNKFLRFFDSWYLSFRSSSRGMNLLYEATGITKTQAYIMENLHQRQSHQIHFWYSWNKMI